MLTDEKIMLNVTGGDLQQLGVLFNRYQIPLYNYFYRLNYDQSLSEDLTQNVFERIIKYKKSYTEAFPFKAWLFKIARNVNTDHFRGKRILKDDNIELANVNITTDNVLDDIEKRERNERLEIALQTLDKDEREMIVLSRFEEIKYSEIAQLMGLTESNIKVKIHRAIKKLKCYYENSMV